MDTLYLTLQIATMQREEFSHLLPICPENLHFSL
jgi:hypothetical protein